MQSKLKLKKNVPVIECNATERLIDKTFIAQAIRECLKSNDLQGVIEIIEMHLDTLEKACQKSAKKV